jgi:hypothetical protein
MDRELATKLAEKRVEVKELQEELALAKSSALQAQGRFEKERNAWETEQSRAKQADDRQLLALTHERLAAAKLRSEMELSEAQLKETQRTLEAKDSELEESRRGLLALTHSLTA